MGSEVKKIVWIDLRIFVSILNCILCLQNIISFNVLVNFWILFAKLEVKFKIFDKFAVLVLWVCKMANLMNILSVVGKVF